VKGWKNRVFSGGNQARRDKEERGKDESSTGIVSS